MTADGPGAGPVRALIVVDVQNDFCEGGSLPVQGGGAVVAAISRHIAGHHYAAIAATRDFHIDPGGHFSENPDYVDSWPVHCKAGTPGADFHPAFDAAVVGDAIFSSGQYSAGYSGFEGHSADGSTLEGWLRTARVNEVDVVGIATDHCVRATAIDAARAGFATTVLTPLTIGVSPVTTESALAAMRTAGVRLQGRDPSAPSDRVTISDVGPE